MNTIFADPKTEYVSELDLPWINWEIPTWTDQLIDLVKEIIARFIEYLPMLVLILLLLACLKIIFDWDVKEWGKRIKYILIGVWLMILSIYIVNLLSTITTWAPLINIRLNRFF